METPDSWWPRPAYVIRDNDALWVILLGLVMWLILITGWLIFRMGRFLWDCALLASHGVVIVWSRSMILCRRMGRTHP
jgi:hypothetical protein